MYVNGLRPGTQGYALLFTGMSQYGANAMARDGSGFRDILTWYYTGAQVDFLW